MGLHAHQFAGFDKDAVAADLGVPAYVRLMSGIAVGRSGDPDDVPERDREREHRPRIRKGLPELVHGDGWGHPGWTARDEEPPAEASCSWSSSRW